MRIDFELTTFSASDHAGDRQAAVRLEHSKRFAQNATLVAREIDHAIRNDHIDGVVGQRPRRKVMWSSLVLQTLNPKEALVRVSCDV